MSTGSGTHLWNDLNENQDNLHVSSAFWFSFFGEASDPMALDSDATNFVDSARNTVASKK